VENMSLILGIIPKTKETYKLDLKDKLEKKKIVDSIPNKEIKLYSVGKMLWSIKLDGKGKRVEEAAQEYFENIGYRDISYFYIQYAITACMLSSVKPKSRLWKAIIKSVQNLCLVTPKMYDEGYPLSIVWCDTDPRLKDEDREIIRQHIAGLSDDFTSHDALLKICSALSDIDKQDKTRFKSAMSKAINSLPLPQEQIKILCDAFEIFGKHTTKSDLKNGPMLGSIFSAFDADDIIKNAYQTDLYAFEKTIPLVKEALDAEGTRYRNKSAWRQYKVGLQKNTPKDDILSFREFVNSPKLDETGIDVHGDRWNIYKKNSDRDEDFLDLCTKVFRALGPERIINYALLDKWRFTRSLSVSGHSDLEMWDGSKVCFIEVKSPSDRLQDNQIDRYNSVMRPAGLNYLIAKVKQIN